MRNEYPCSSSYGEEYERGVKESTRYVLTGDIPDDESGFG